MIDKKPAVGRILFRTSVLMHGHFQRCGIITRVGDKTVRYGDKGLLYMLSVAAVCDTEDEAAALEAFDKRARHTVLDTIRRFQFEAQVLTHDLEGDRETVKRVKQALIDNAALARRKP